MTYLLRVVMPDRPGMLGAIATALGDAGVGTITDVHRLQVDEVALTGEDVRLVLRPSR